MKTIYTLLGVVLLSGAFVLPIQAQSNDSAGVAPALEAQQTQELSDVRREPIQSQERVPTRRVKEVDVEGLAAIIMGCLVPICIVGLVFYFTHRRNQMMHETVRTMVEKGLPVSPELIAELKSKKHSGNACARPRNDFRAGLILMGVGFGIVMIGAKPGWIVFLLGVAFLIASIVEPTAPITRHSPDNPCLFPTLI